MSLQEWQQKIQEKRKKTSFRDFLLEIAPWFTLVFYKRDGMITKYPPSDRIYKVMSPRAFDDSIDERMQTKTYDMSLSFFEQFGALFSHTIHASTLEYGSVENTSYANEVLGAKNVYLSSTVVMDCEDVLYSNNVKEGSTGVLNSVMVWNNSQEVYMSVGIIQSSHVFYSRCITNSFDIWFSSDCVGCTSCVLCQGLENASYCIKNKQYTKEEYTALKAQILRKKDQFETWYTSLSPQGKNIGSTNVTGSFVCQSEDVENGLYCFQMRKARNVVMRGGKGLNEYMADIISGGTVGNEHIYAVTGAGAGSDNLYCSCHTVGSHIYYSYFIENCSYCFGCVGLKNKQFCILNVQYTKDARHEKVEEIFQKMENTPLLTSPQGEEKRDINGDIVTELGEFFPGWMCPYYFNDTLAFHIEPDMFGAGDSFTKEEVMSKGYLRREEKVRVDIPEEMEVVKVSELGKYEGRKTPHLTSPQGEEATSSGEDKGEWWIDPEIMKKVIQDEEGNVYKIVKMEYDFLMKYGLPLPRLHWLERLKRHFRVR